MAKMMYGVCNTVGIEHSWSTYWLLLRLARKRILLRWIAPRWFWPAPPRNSQILNQEVWMGVIFGGIAIRRNCEPLVSTINNVSIDTPSLINDSQPFQTNMSIHVHCVNHLNYYQPPSINHYHRTALLTRISNHHSYRPLPITILIII